MTTLARLWIVAVVTGVVWQVPVHRTPPQPVTSGCSREIAGFIHDAGWPVTASSALTCTWPVGEPDLPTVRVALRDRTPRSGEPCADVHLDRVAFVIDGAGVWAKFALFGGASLGAMPLPPDQVQLAGRRAAYVVDAQLGTYEAVASSERPGLACTVDPTFHFDCPTTHELDQLCLVWLRDQLEETDG